MICEGFSRYGSGRRTLFANLICEPEDNFIPTLDPEPFWTEAENREIVTVQSDGAVKFSANGKRYVKWFAAKPHTSYFLSFYGRTEPPVWTDLNFGILGEDGLPFENFHTKKEEAFYVSKNAQDQLLTVKGQDGEWYRRAYMFTVGDTERVGFFASGTQGTVFLNRIYLCEATKIRNPVNRRESMIFNPSEDLKDCLPQNNVIRDISFFSNGENFGDFVDVSEDGLHYSFKRRGCYYIVRMPLQEDRVYTIAYSDEVKKEGGCVYGFIAENESGKRRWLLKKSAEYVHGKERNADAVALVKGEKIAFAVYDGGGEVKFSDFKIFLLGNGIDKGSEN